MKAIYICYNYFTLYKAIYNSEHLFNDDETLIIYISQVTDLHHKDSMPYPIRVIPFRMKENEGKILRYFYHLNWLIVIRKVLGILRNEIRQSKDLKLVVFKDSEMSDSTFIDYFKKQTDNQGEVVLIEEGNTLYWPEDAYERTKKSKWRIVQKLLGLSEYFLYNHSHGDNPLVDKIICADADKFRQLKGRSNIELIEQRGIYDLENSRRFVENVLGKPITDLMNYQSFRAVHLTMPVNDIAGLQVAELERQILEIVDEVLDQGLLIKKHPRDDRAMIYKQTPKFTTANEEISSLPIECLYGLMNHPIILNYFSSAYSNIIIDNPDTKVILLYRLFNHPPINELMDGIVDIEMETYRNIFRPNDLNEFRGIISHLLEEQNSGR